MRYKPCLLAALVAAGAVDHITHEKANQKRSSAVLLVSGRLRERRDWQPQADQKQHNAS